MNRPGIAYWNGIGETLKLMERIRWHKQTWVFSCYWLLTKICLFFTIAVQQASGFHLSIHMCLLVNLPCFKGTHHSYQTILKVLLRSKQVRIPLWHLPQNNVMLFDFVSLWRNCTLGKSRWKSHTRDEKLGFKGSLTDLFTLIFLFLA